MAARRKKYPFTVYDVHALDVWGNKRDGFEVNDVYPSSGKVTLRDNSTKKDVIQALKREGFIRTGIRMNSIGFDGEFGERLYIDDMKDGGRPVYELRAVTTRTGRTVIGR